AGVVRAFHEGLAETGFSEGRNIMIEYRWGEGNYDRLQALAEDLVRLKVAILVTTGGEPSAPAGKGATSRRAAVTCQCRDFRLSGADQSQTGDCCPSQVVKGLADNACILARLPPVSRRN